MINHVYFAAFSIILIAGMIFASISDLKKGIIPNWLCLVIGLGGILSWKSIEETKGHFLVLLFIFVFGYFRLMGMGDIKLWMAVSMYFSFRGTLLIMLLSAVLLIIYALATEKDAMKTIRLSVSDIALNKRLLVFHQKKYAFAPFLAVSTVVFYIITYLR